MSSKWPQSQLVLTRLHLRYGPDDLGEDLVFQAAPPISGGLERSDPSGQGTLRGAHRAGVNRFQARYAIRHPWTGPIACPEPRRNRWGSAPGGAPPPGPQTASDLAFVARGASLTEFLVGEPGTTETALPEVPPYREPPPSAAASGCARCEIDDGVGGVALLVGLLGLRRRRCYY